MVKCSYLGWVKTLFSVRDISAQVAHSGTTSPAHDFSSFLAFSGNARPWANCALFTSHIRLFFPQLFSTFFFWTFLTSFLLLFREEVSENSGMQIWRKKVGICNWDLSIFWNKIYHMMNFKKKSRKQTFLHSWKKLKSNLKKFFPFFPPNSIKPKNSINMFSTKINPQKLITRQNTL